MKTSLNLYGPINQLGYGQHFTHWSGHTAAAMARLGHQVSIVPRGEIQVPTTDRVSHALHNVMMRVSNPSLFDPKAPSIMLWHLSNVAEFTGSRRIFYTVFEGTRLNPLERENLTKIDALIVPTHWHAERIAEQSWDKTAYVIPEGIDPSTFFPGDTGVMGHWNRPGDEDQTVFVSVGKFEKRKGMIVAIDALKQVASYSDRRIRLLAHWFNPFIGAGGRAFLKSLTDWLKERGFTKLEFREELPSLRTTHDQLENLELEILTMPLPSQHDVVSLYRAGHWGLFPHYAEGWGLPLQESMSCSLPPITQNYSGPSEYLQPGTYLPLDGIEAVAQDSHFFKRGDVGTWRQVLTESLVQQIITALNTPPDERRLIGERAAKAAGVYTWERSAEKTIEVLKELEVIQ